MHTHMCIHSWKSQLDLSDCPYQFSSAKENQASLLSSISESQDLRAHVAIALYILYGWIYRENKTKQNKVGAAVGIYGRVYMCEPLCICKTLVSLPSPCDLVVRLITVAQALTETTCKPGILSPWCFPISAHGLDTHSLAVPEDISWMSNQSQC